MLSFSKIPISELFVRMCGWDKRMTKFQSKGFDFFILRVPGCVRYPTGSAAILFLAFAAAVALLQIGRLGCLGTFLIVAVANCGWSLLLFLLLFLLLLWRRRRRRKWRRI
jgi:hypothetical protein